MLKDKLAQIYLELWREGWSEREPRSFVYYVSNETCPHGSLGRRRQHFFPKWDDQDHDSPTIWIERTPAPVKSHEPALEDADLDELMALAHELGHLDSYRNGTYVSSADRAVSPSTRMAEEVNAWAYAEARLRALGFEMWSAFEDLRARALASYRDDFAAEASTRAT